MPPTRPVDAPDALGVLDVFHQLFELRRRIPGQPRKWSLLPKAGEEVGIGARATVGRIHGSRRVSRHGDDTAPDEAGPRPGRSGRESPSERPSTSHSTTLETERAG